jgi:hypothetical protein
MLTLQRTLYTIVGAWGWTYSADLITYPTLIPINVLFDATNTVLEHHVEQYQIEGSAGQVEMMHVILPFLFEAIDAHLGQRGVVVGIIGMQVARYGSTRVT